MQVNKVVWGGLGIALLTLVLPACQGNNSPSTPAASDIQTEANSPEIQTFTGVVEEVYETGPDPQLIVQLKNEAGESKDFPLFNVSPSEFPEGKTMTLTYSLERNPKVIALRRLDETPKDRQALQQDYPNLPIASVQGKYLEGSHGERGTYIRLQEDTGEVNTWLAKFNPEFANNDQYKGHQVSLSYVQPEDPVVIDYEVVE
ncbi:hypothetical protein PN462_13090 [Spirulina sp. CS-785/01]|uniref:hypothetical protein n=1 Tax=Spirulina sp. CS-785/01 TaxID=3021716 RepID=UPI00232EA936|nr:hypothetical protein [Spirulina sp. CS-785/01]MDB9314040.1 hypothetical protein [Spirulina sp. CS-785/01]